MEAKAIARYIRQSPRKVRLLADMVRGMSVEAALDQLRVSRKVAGVPMAKLLRSAMANAKGKGLESKTLFVKQVTVDGGPVLKRSRARAFGRSAPIYHRTSHITIIIGARGASSAAKRIEASKAAAEVVAQAASSREKAPKLATTPAKPRAAKPSEK